jgi:2,3-diketo-5-methylthio-1-phosphopentane phosphatase
MLPRSPTLVTDFDGTITAYDFFNLVRESWPNPGEPDPWELYLGGQITHFEALRRIFIRVRCPEEAALRILERMAIDPTFPEAIDRLTRCGWKIVIASAGCQWYIDRLLGAARTKVEVHANPGAFSPSEGLVMSLPSGSAYFSAETGIDKLAIMRDALRDASRIAFAGDGRPDLAPALLAQPERRFARGWLAEELTTRQEPFQPLTNWRDLADHLLNEPLQP